MIWKTITIHNFFTTEQTQASPVILDDPGDIKSKIHFEAAIWFAGRGSCSQVCTSDPRFSDF